MKKLLGIVVLGLLLSGNAFADRTVTFKCIFDRENYEYIINWHRDTYNEIFLRNMQTKEMYYSDALKSSVDITVINRDRSYNFKGFKNNGSNSVQHNFVFLDRSNTLFADLQATLFDDERRAVEFKIIAYDDALEQFLVGTCKAIY